MKAFVELLQKEHEIGTLYILVVKTFSSVIWKIFSYRNVSLNPLIFSVNALLWPRLLEGIQ